MAKARWLTQVEIDFSRIGPDGDFTATREWVWLADGAPGGPGYTGARERARRFATPGDAFTAARSFAAVGGADHHRIHRAR